MHPSKMTCPFPGVNERAGPLTDVIGACGSFAPMLTLDLSDFPVLTTDRLVMRELSINDAPALFAMRSDDRVMRHIGRPRATSVEDAIKLIERIANDRSANEGITWGLTLNGDDALIGTIGYYRLKLEHHRGEIGYMLGVDHWAKGLMGEALDAAVECGFERFRFHSIEATADPRNARSNKLLERHGFVREGLFRENFHWNGEFQDSAVWSKLAPR
jgi:ribosomal-protein-alanine N-acetyltransferase